MTHSTGSLTGIGRIDSSAGLNGKTIDEPSLNQRVASISAAPLNTPTSNQQEKGWWGKLSDWLWGPSEGQTTDKVSSVSTPQVLNQHNYIDESYDSYDSEDDYTESDDDDEYFDPYESFEEMEQVQEQEAKAEKKEASTTSFKLRPLARKNNFGPPPMWEAYGLGKEEAEQKENEIQEARQRRIDETIEDDRSWMAYGANLAAQYLPGAETILKNEWVRSKIKSNLFGGTDFKAIGQEMRKELRILSGDTKLAKVAGILSGKLSEIVLKDITDDNDPNKNKVQDKHNFPGFKPFIDTEKEFLNQVFEALILKAVLNLTKNTKLRLSSNFNGDLPTEVLKDLLKIVNEGLDEVSPETFKEIKKLRNINDRNREFRKLFKPISDKFLAIALPNGKDDLELGQLSETVWSSVAEKAIPDLFVKVYELTHQPPHHSDEDLKTLERPGGEALKKLAKFVAEKTKKELPSLLNKHTASIDQLDLSKFLGDSSENAWLKEWIKDLSTQILTSDDSDIQRIWDYAGENIESIIIHALANLGTTKDSSVDRSGKNIVSDVASNGLKILEDFFTKNKEDIDKAFEETANLSEKEKNDRLNALFQPLSDKILEESDLQDNPFVALVKDEYLPAILREFYRDMYLYQEDLTTDSEALKDKLLDPVAHIHQASDTLIEEYGEVLSNPEEGKKILWEKSGIGKVVDELEASCGLFAEDIIRILKNFTENDKATIGQKLNSSIFKGYELTADQEKELSEGLQEFFGSDSESLKKTWEYSETIVKAALFKVFAAIAKNENVEGEDNRTENKNTKIVGNVAHRVLSFLNKKIPVIDAGLKKLQNDSKLSEEEKELEIRKLYQPLAEDFLALAGDDLEKILPVPEMVKAPLKELLKTTLLPAIFHDMYSQLNKGREEAPENAKKLDEIVLSGSAFVQSIADYIEEFVPYYMETNPEIISEIAMKATEKYVKVLSTDSQNQLGDLLAKNIKQLGEDPEMAKTSKAISEYSKGMILKVFAGITQNIHQKESQKDAQGQNHFLLNTSIGFIKLLSDHVKRINEIPPEGRMYPAHIVPHRYMHKGFADDEHYDKNMLHPALAKDYAKGVTQEEKDKQRMNEFFIPFSKNLLETAGVTDPKDLPVPEAVREEVWGLFQEKILPEVMMNVFKEVMKPETLNTVMLKTFDALNEALDEIDEDIRAEDIEEEELDEQQEMLNEALGTLVKEMVELVPDFWTMTVFNSEKIKNMTAASIGQIVRRKLDDTTMIELLNKGLEGFSMSKPGEDHDKTPAQKSKENKRIEKELNQKMTAYISKQAKEKFQNFIKSKWDNFHDKFDKGVEKHLGKPGLAIKHFFDDILHFIFFDVLGPVFNFIVFKVLWFFVDMKIAEKSKEIIKDVQMPIHENLVYNVCDEWAKSMKGQQKVEETKTQLIQAFEKKRKEEEEAARIQQEEKAAKLKKEQEEAERIANEKLVKEQIKKASSDSLVA